MTGSHEVRGSIPLGSTKIFNEFRYTVLPEKIRTALQQPLARVKQIHERDLADGYGRVPLPYALDRKYPNASTEWGWQYIFPQAKRWINQQTREQGRHQC